MRVSVSVRFTAFFVAALGSCAGQEQTGVAAPASAARIVELAPAAEAPLEQLLREPAARPSGRELAAIPVAPPRRTQFVLPDITPPPPLSESPPELRTRPDFGALPLVPPQLAQPASESPLSRPTIDWPSSPERAAPTTKEDRKDAGGVAFNPPEDNPPAKSNKPSALTASPPLPSTAPRPSTALNHEGMRGVAEQAARISDRGFAMAQRGMVYAGRAELIRALQLIAQALDAQAGRNVHLDALTSGLTALEEARDFSSSKATPHNFTNVAEIALTHRTPLIKASSSAADVSSLAAQQQYLGFAQGQLSFAAGNQPVASLALYRLGRLETAPAAQETDPQAMHAARAMVFHQAALAADAANYLAANELGVLLANYGRLADSRRLLLHSVMVHPQVEAWHNLAIVHRRLGEEDLARRAEVERDLVAKQTGSPTARRAKDMVRWVDPPTFAASGARDIPWPETTAAANAVSNAAPR